MVSQLLLDQLLPKGEQIFRLLQMGTTRKFIAKRIPDDIAISKFDVGLECTTIVQVQLKKNSLKLGKQQLPVT